MDSPLETFVPEPMFHELHELRTDASPDAVWTALTTLTPGDLPAVRLLMGARSLSARPAYAPTGSGTMIGSMIERGWFQLAEEPGRHITIGAISQFWRLNTRPWRRSCPPHEFATFSAPGFAKAATMFQVVADGDGTLIRTETRVTASDAGARRRMAAYWLLIRPFSGLIRRVILRATARRAAGASAPPPSPRPSS